MTQPDPFDDARPGFVRLDDLLGRLIAVIPQSIEERESTLPKSQGKKYESITADVIVLDGKPTDMVEAVPVVLEGIFFSGSVVVNQLKPKLRKQPHERMVLGRLGQQPARTKGFGDAWVLEAPTDKDKEIARGPAREYLEKNTDPFAAAT